MSRVFHRCRSGPPDGGATTAELGTHRYSLPLAQALSPDVIAAETRQTREAWRSYLDGEGAADLLHREVALPEVHARRGARVPANISLTAPVKSVLSVQHDLLESDDLREHWRSHWKAVLRRL